MYHPWETKKMSFIDITLSYDAFSPKNNLMANGVWVVLGPETISTLSSKNLESGYRSSEPMFERNLMKYTFDIYLFYLMKRNALHHAAMGE